MSNRGILVTGGAGYIGSHMVKQLGEAVTGCAVPEDVLGSELLEELEDEVDKEDAAENELSVRLHFRILSAYRTNKGVRLWVITEADRSSTTILLPEEY